MRSVDVDALRPERFEDVMGHEAYSALFEAVRGGRNLLAGRRLWHVNSSAAGGGVAEMLRPLVGYQRGAGWDGGWLTIEGDEEFFTVTKRIHNHLHGDGAGGGLSRPERRAYERVLAGQLGELRSMVRGGDLVLLHDPQTLGMAPALAEAGVTIVWVCHIGIDEPNDVARDAWDFLRGYLDLVAACLFSRPSYAWSGIDADRVRIVPPAIDPFSAKNQPLEDDTVRDVLHAAGVFDGPPRRDPAFERADGSRGRITERVRCVEDEPVPASARVVAQVSRWDRLKDHVGVLRGFAEHVPPDEGVHLLLVGPEPDGVGDDPEQEAVLREVTETREALSPALRALTHVVRMPIGDAEASHAIVNAIQRHADVIVQKSLAEGFGLTVAEGMWKSRPVLAGRVGGIQDQIDDGRTGVLIDDPRDLATFGAALTGLLRDPARESELGRNAHEAVRERFLLARYLVQLVGIVDDVAGERDARSEAL
jgi:trehalose synthase